MHEMRENAHVRVVGPAWVCGRGRDVAVADGAGGYSVRGSRKIVTLADGTWSQERCGGLQVHVCQC